MPLAVAGAPYGTDAETGKSLQYNLFVPKNYDRTRSYPMVLFMHDAGTVSSNPLITLTQGLGAVVWASPTEQAKHESFVLAPQFTGEDEGSDGNTTYLKTIKGLIDSVRGKYSIDTGRLYTTGQSGGAMTSSALDFNYPDLFAASFLVAGFSGRTSTPSSRWPSRRSGPWSRRATRRRTRA